MSTPNTVLPSKEAIVYSRAERECSRSRAQISVTPKSRVPTWKQLHGVFIVTGPRKLEIKVRLLIILFLEF